MFETTSRYYALETTTFVNEDGTQVSYKKRRFLPEGRNMPLLTEIKPQQGERLDLLTARLLGDPEQFWRICDANNVNNPKELAEDESRFVKIPIPQA